MGRAEKSTALWPKPAVWPKPGTGMGQSALDVAGECEKWRVGEGEGTPALPALAFA